MTDRYEKIRKALAMGPTPGPFSTSRSYSPGNQELILHLTHKDEHGITENYCTVRNRLGDTWKTEADAAHIAACDPDTIRELLAERDALTAEVERVRGELREQRQHDEALLRQALEALKAENERLRAEVERLRRGSHPAITHCDNCGCDWLDNGLNPIGCPYCELRREVERRWDGNRRATQEYLEDMRDVLREAAQVCKDLDEEAMNKENRLACGAECAAAIADVAARWNVPFERAGSLSKENGND